MLFNLLPFIVGRNLIETTLISRREIYGFSIFDVKYFFAIYLSDLFLFLIYQDYFSHKFFKNKNNAHNNNLIDRNFKIALFSLVSFFALVLVRSLNHELAHLLFFGSLIIVKYILVFSLPIIVDFKKRQKDFHQVIAANVFFQSVIIFIEQVKGGNIGAFIENRLPGLEMGTLSAESSDLLRANGTFNEPNIAAIFLLMNFAILSYLAIKIPNKKTKINNLYFSIGLMSLLAIIFTGSRSLYALSLIYLVFYLTKYKRKLVKFFKNIWGKSLVKIAVSGSLIIMLPYFLSRMDSLMNVFTSTGSLSYRGEINKAVLSMSYKNFFGIGLDLTPYYLAKNFKTVDSLPVVFDQAPAHNISIQILAETGFLAFLIFVFFVYFSLKKGLKTKNQVFSIAALLYFIAAQFHPVFSNHYQLTAFFFLYLGLGMYKETQS